MVGYGELVGDIHTHILERHILTGERGSLVMVLVTLETAEVEFVLVELQEDGIAVGIAHVALTVHGIDVDIFGGAVGMGELVGLDAHGSLVGIGITDLQLGSGAVGQVELGCILEMVVAARFVFFVFCIYSVGIAGIDVGGILTEIQFGIGKQADTLHRIVQRRQHGRELAREFVGGDGDALGGIVRPISRDDGVGHPGIAVVEVTGLGSCLPSQGGAYRLLCGIHHIVGLQFNLGHTNVVDRGAEAHGAGLLDGTAIHTSRHHHQRIVPKGQSGHGPVEVMLARFGIASVQGEGMATALH